MIDEQKGYTRKGRLRSIYFKNPELWKAIEDVATSENRSVNNYLETVLAAHLLSQALKKATPHI